MKGGVPLILWPFCILLGAVFGVAGIAKLRDPVGATEAFTQLGIPPRLASAARIILPVVELAVAASLFVPRSAAVGAVTAGSLLVVFSLIVAVRLARGEHPSCSCFGRLGTERIGAGTLARNGALFALAALVAVQGWGHPERFAWDGLASAFTARGRLAPTVGMLLGAVVAFQGWLLLQLMRRHGLLLIRIDKLEVMLGFDETANAIGLSLGTKAPDFGLESVHGETITLDSLLALGKPLMLMFTDPGCGPCATLMPDVAGWQQEPGAILTVALISRGDGAINRATAAEYGLANVLIQDDREIAGAYRSPGTPSAVLIGRDGIIRSRIVAGVDAIRTLVDDTRETAAVVLGARSNGNAQSRRAIHVRRAQREQGRTDE